MSKKKSKVNIPGIILIISAMFLGVLIVILVAGNKKKITIGNIEGDREIQGAYPMPAELKESDKEKYFSYMEIPDMIFNKISGVSFTEDCPVSRGDLRYMQVLYWGKDGKPHTGELIVNKLIAKDVQELFYRLYASAYSIERVELIDTYGGNDEVSMAKNNTSCFNARKVRGTDEWSMHAYGLAIDINPLYNPYVAADGTVLPISGEKYADRTLDFDMKIDESNLAYKIFMDLGFEWGGSWSTVKDYQHFEKKTE